MKVVPYIGRFQAVRIALFGLSAGWAASTAFDFILAGHPHTATACFILAVSLFGAIAEILTPAGRRYTLEPHEIEVAQTPAIYFKSGFSRAEMDQLEDSLRTHPIRLERES